MGNTPYSKRAKLVNGGIKRVNGGKTVFSLQSTVTVFSPDCRLLLATVAFFDIRSFNVGCGEGG